MAPGDAGHDAQPAETSPHPDTTEVDVTAPATTTAPATDPALEHGAGVVNTSRVSVARHLTARHPALPFTPQQLSRLDEALTFAGRETGVHFSVYLGELGEDSRTRAEELFGTLGAQGSGAVLIAVSPGQRVVELVTGAVVQRRITDRAARLAVTAMVASFREGDLAGGLVSALRMLADQAGAPRH